MREGKNMGIMATLKKPTPERGGGLRLAWSWPGESVGRLGDAPGVWHTLARTADRAALGGTRPDEGGLTRYNLHSVRGGNLVGPGRYAVCPTRS